MLVFTLDLKFALATKEGREISKVLVISLIREGASSGMNIAQTVDG